MINKKEQAMANQPQVDPATGQPIQGQQMVQQQPMLPPEVVQQLQQDYNSMQGTEAMNNIQKLRNL